MFLYLPTVVGGGEPVVNVQKLESMAPEFQSMTQAMRAGGGGGANTPLNTPTILLDKDGQPSPPKPHHHRPPTTHPHPPPSEALFR